MDIKALLRDGQLTPDLKDLKQAEAMMMDALDREVLRMAGHDRQEAARAVLDVKRKLDLLNKTIISKL